MEVPQSPFRFCDLQIAASLDTCAVEPEELRLLCSGSLNHRHGTTGFYRITPPPKVQRIRICGHPGRIRSMAVYTAYPSDLEIVQILNLRNASAEQPKTSTIGGGFILGCIALRQASPPWLDGKSFGSLQRVKSRVRDRWIHVNWLPQLAFPNFQRPLQFRFASDDEKRRKRKECLGKPQWP